MATATVHITHDPIHPAEDVHTVNARAAVGLDSLEITLRVDRRALTPTRARQLIDHLTQRIHEHLDSIDPSLELADITRPGKYEVYRVES